MNEDLDCLIFNDGKLQAELLWCRRDIIFRKWDSLELNFLSKVKITLHNAKVARSNKTLISHLAEWTKSSARWRHGGQIGPGNTCEHSSMGYSDLVTIRELLGQLHLTHRSRKSDHLGHGQEARRKDKHREQLLHKMCFEGNSAAAGNDWLWEK